MHLTCVDSVWTHSGGTSSLRSPRSGGAFMLSVDWVATPHLRSSSPSDERHDGNLIVGTSRATKLQPQVFEPFPTEACCRWATVEALLARASLSSAPRRIKQSSLNSGPDLCPKPASKAESASCSLSSLSLISAVARVILVGSRFVRRPSVRTYELRMRHMPASGHTNERGLR